MLRRLSPTCFYRLWSAVVMACIVLLQSCMDSPKGEINPLGKRSEGATQDLPHIQESGVLIAAMLSGPDTYYEHRGQAMGQQYALIEHFAVAQGVSVRIELAHDTTELLDLITSLQADVVAVPLPDSLLEAHSLQPMAMQKGKGAWAVRSDEPLLADALQRWYSDSLLLTAERTSAARGTTKAYVRRHVYAPMVSQSAGIISSYDNLFKEAAARIGWDWRLVAALCYQESAFDPQAESWAGARGLMQLMPATATALGVSQADVYKPDVSIEAGVRYLGQLYQKFPELPATERIKFAIASYNGGFGHVRDAMALARKYGGNPYTWDGISPYILALSEPQFYRDPVVNYGYMRGSETHDYVYSIMKRWASYGGQVAVGRPSGMPHHVLGGGGAHGDSRASRSHKRNRFSTVNDIKRPDDPDFGARVTPAE